MGCFFMKDKSILALFLILLLLIGGFIYYLYTPELDVDNLYVEKYKITTKYTSGKVETDYYIDYSFDVVYSKSIDEISGEINFYDKKGNLIEYDRFTDGVHGGYYTFTIDKEVYKKIDSAELKIFNHENDEYFDIINTSKIHKGENSVDKIDDVIEYTPTTTSTASSSSSYDYDSYSSSYNSYPDTSGYGNYIGNSNTHKFHESFCSWADNIKPGNRVSFSSREDALSSGYSPCGHCNP